MRDEPAHVSEHRTGTPKRRTRAVPDTFGVIGSKLLVSSGPAGTGLARGRRRARVGRARRDCDRSARRRNELPLGGSPTIVTLAY